MFHNINIRTWLKHIPAFAGMSGVVCALSLLALPATAQSLHPLTTHPEDIWWPAQSWEQGDMPAETDVLVQSLIDKAMSGEKSDEMGETRAIMIVYRGQLVAEAYREGFTRHTKQMSWSMAKSITSSLVGRAVHMGLIESIDDPMPSLFPEGDARAEITWRQWLNMTEGLDYHEISDVPLTENDVAQMMFGRGKLNVAQYAVDELPPKQTPGEHWKYSTMGYHLIGWALEDVTSGGRHKYEWNEVTFDKWRVGALRKIRSEAKFGRIHERQLERAEAMFANAKKRPPEDRGKYTYDSMFKSWMKYNLFNRLSMHSFQPEFDSSGTYLGGSSVWASASDYAKFGYLYLRDGVWNDRRQLPEGWVDFARTKTPAENNNTYGAGFWITTYGEEPTIEQAVRSPPWDSFHAGGSEGQTIWIVPSRDLVIVRLGQMENSIENWNLLFEWNQEISRAFPEVTASP